MLKKKQVKRIKKIIRDAKKSIKRNMKIDEEVRSENYITFLKGIIAGCAIILKNESKR
jgi:hypothetical protein